MIQILCFLGVKPDVAGADQLSSMATLSVLVI